jgi:hypothetical protein
MKRAIILTCVIFCIPLISARSIQVLPKIYPLCKEGPYPSLFIDSGNQLGLPPNQYVICSMRYYPLIFNCSDGLEWNWGTLTCDYPQRVKLSQSQGPVFYPFPVHTKPYIPPEEVQFHWPITLKPERRIDGSAQVPPISDHDQDQPIHRPWIPAMGFDEPMERPFPEVAEFPQFRPQIPQHPSHG